MGDFDSINYARDARTGLAQTRRLANAAGELESAVSQARQDLGQAAKAAGDTSVLKAAGNTSSFGKGMGIAGVASAVAGFSLAAKEGNIPRMIQNLSDMGSSLKDVIKTLPTEKIEALFSKIPGGTELLKQVGGPLAIVSGITGAIATLKDAEKNGWNLEKGLKMSSSVLTTVAGVAMMVPGGQPVAAAAGIAAAGLGLGAMAVHYQDKLADGAKAVGNAVSEGAQSVGSAIGNGASAVTNGAMNMWRSVFG